MNEKSTRGWKFYVGLALFIFSFATIVIAALTPFLFSAATAATVATSVVVSGEIGFLASAALLGKPFVEAIKTKIKALFTSRTGPVPPRPVSRSRHAFGLVLFSLSFVTYYVVVVIPFFGLVKTTELKIVIIVAILGELLFVVSLFVLGGEFWGRIKALFQWQGQSDVPSQPCVGN
jgi:hypothetical protein